MSLVPPERLKRVLGLPQSVRRSLLAKIAAVLAVLGLLAAALAARGFTPGLSHVRAAILSGNERGNYYAFVNALAAEVRAGGGRVVNIPSKGSVENMARLMSARTACDVQFALVQDGLAWPTDPGLELIGRLPKGEVLVFLGRDADRIRSLADLRGKRIGIGPVGSGTEQVVRQVLAPLGPLDLTLSNHDVPDQLARAERGELDLAAMVIAEDAKLLTEAVRDRGLQILSLPHASLIARGLPAAREERIEAGQYDLARMLPPADKHVLGVGTLVVGNGCARRSVTQGLITAIAAIRPDFVRYNRDSPNPPGLRMAPAARAYFDNQGPDVLGVYAPWLADIMPTGSWVQLAFLASVLFNAMALMHRFRLSRLDVNRVRAEGMIAEIFGPGVTVGEIAEMAPAERHRRPEVQARLQAVIGRLSALSERCRRQSLSILVPMGQEMAYRYQEALIADSLYALRAFSDRLGR